MEDKLTWEAKSTEKKFWKIAVAITAALAFILPGAASFANDKKIMNKNMLDAEHSISAPEITLDDTIIGFNDI